MEDSDRQGRRDQAPKIRNMQEFADVIGVSRPTISKYFNQPSSVRQSTRRRIEEALTVHDYHPNIFAINQNRRLTKNVGIVVPYLADPFFAELARQIEERCLAAGLSPLLFSAHGRQDLECDILKTLRSLKPAGVLMAPLGRRSDRKMVSEFCRDVPTILFDSNLEDIGEAFIGSDNNHSIGLIVDYLCETGEPPCFVEMMPVNPNANKRRHAYLQAMEHLGHMPQVIRVEGQGWDFEQIGYDGGRRVLARREFATNTVLCSNDRLAIGLLAAAYEMGLRVGCGSGCAMRIAGHDDHPFARFTCPPLTTMTQDYAAIAERSVDKLLEVIMGDGAVEGRETTLFHGALVRRASA